jgi:biotin carboxylase
MNVIMIAPGFPAEMCFFTRGLARVGARVIGVGDQPRESLPPMVRESLSAHVRVESLWDEDAVVAQVRRETAHVAIDRVECLWEAAMILAAKLREALEVPGMGVEQTILFRDKEAMKQALDAAGIRTARHRRAATDDERRSAAERIGYPVILKPISGAGSADTHRVNGPEELDAALRSVRHVPELSVEEFIQGEEHTFDTIAIEGRIAYFNIAWYRPPPLIGRTVEWISPQTVTLRDVETPALAPGRALGREVLRALGFQTGFTHMEWFLTPKGEAVFGEIAARSPGARSVDLMNFSCDIDTYTGWAEAVCHGSFSQPVERRYNTAAIFKRAHGAGRIQRIEGLERLIARYRPHVVWVELLPVGTPRRNWKQTLISDGYVIVRHPDLQATLEIADRFGTDLQLYAG